MKQTPLHDVHMDLGARMVNFAGWSVPLNYGSILEEAKAVRTRAGLFDVSHMGRLVVEGPMSEPFLQRLTTNDVSRLAPGQGHYTLLCNDHGGIIDDLIAFHLVRDSYLLVVNALNTRRDLEWLKFNASEGVSVTDLTADTSLLALQGPMATELVAAAAGGNVDLARFACSEITISDTRVFVSRTGYTGEDGYEFMCPNEMIHRLWAAFAGAGGPAAARLCGLGARDVLRIEAGYVLYGQEIDENTNPIDAGLSRFVRMAKREFVGRDALLSLSEQGATRVLTGIRMNDRVVPRHGSAVTSGGESIGFVTSGTFSPTISRGIGLGYVDANKHSAGLEVEISIREKLYTARLAATPLYKLGETDDVS